MMGGDGGKEKAGAGIKRLSQTLQRRQLMLNVKTSAATQNLYSRTRKVVEKVLRCRLI